MVTTFVPLRAPFPWFGGKSQVASLVWSRFGDVRNFVEPFAGSLAVLLGRPHEPHIETINDLDCYLANFWRALQAEPERLAELTDWPVNEADLHARHLWLIDSGAERVARLRSDPDFYDVQVAAWWVWGLCQWIGAGWCHHPEWKKRPHLGSAGRGVQRPSQKRPHLGNAGRGVHRPSQKRPHLGDAGRDLLPYFQALAERLHRVRVCCGDWTRVLGPTPTEKQGITGIFLDPPYLVEVGRDGDLYAEDDAAVAADVRAWAIEHGDNPMLRIALCGYEGEHEMPKSWTCVPWKAHGGYGGQGDGSNQNAHRERVWFSSACLKPERPMQAVFDWDSQ